MTKNLSEPINILISQLITLAAVFYFGQVFVIQQKRVGMVSINNLRRSTNLFGRNHRKLCLSLRREGRQMFSTEQLLYQTDKSSHTGGVLNKKAVLKNFTIYTGKQLLPATLLKKDSNTGVFLLENFCETPIL